MDQQNVTLSLSSELLREARHLAVDRGMSLSRFVTVVLEEHVNAVRQYRAARDRQRDLLLSGLPLNTGGRIAWTRDELHERPPATGQSPTP